MKSDEAESKTSVSKHCPCCGELEACSEYRAHLAASLELQAATEASQVASKASQVASKAPQVSLSKTQQTVSSKTSLLDASSSSDGGVHSDAAGYSVENGQSESRIAARQIAARLGKLKTATLDTLRKRDRIPHILFWSLFHSEVQEIRDKRQSQRDAKKAALYPFTVDEPENL